MRRDGRARRAAVGLGSRRRAGRSDRGRRSSGLTVVDVDELVVDPVSASTSSIVSGATSSTDSSAGSMTGSPVSTSRFTGGTLATAGVVATAPRRRHAGRARRATVASTPLTNRPESSVENRLASSTASSSTTATGHVGPVEQLEGGDAQHGEIDRRHALAASSRGRCRRSPRRARRGARPSRRTSSWVSASIGTTCAATISATGDSLRLGLVEQEQGPLAGVAALVVGERAARRARRAIGLRPG